MLDETFTPLVAEVFAGKHRISAFENYFGQIEKQFFQALKDENQVKLIKIVLDNTEKIKNMDLLNRLVELQLSSQIHHVMSEILAAQMNQINSNYVQMKIEFIGEYLLIVANN